MPPSLVSVPKPQLNSPPDRADRAGRADRAPARRPPARRWVGNPFATAARLVALQRPRRRSLSQRSAARWSGDRGGSTKHTHIRVGWKGGGNPVVCSTRLRRRRRRGPRQTAAPAAPAARAGVGRRRGVPSGSTAAPRNARVAVGTASKGLTRSWSRATSATWAGRWRQVPPRHDGPTDGPTDGAPNFVHYACMLPGADAAVLSASLSASLRVCLPPRALRCPSRPRAGGGGK